MENYKFFVDGLKNRELMYQQVGVKRYCCIDDIEFEQSCYIEEAGFAEHSLRIEWSA